MRNHSSYENDFDLHENETACSTRFHMKGLAIGLVLKKRHKRTGLFVILTLSCTEYKKTQYFGQSIIISHSMIRNYFNYNEKREINESGDDIFCFSYNCAVRYVRFRID